MEYDQHINMCTNTYSYHIKVVKIGFKVLHCGLISWEIVHHRAGVESYNIGWDTAINTDKTRVHQSHHILFQPGPMHHISKVCERLSNLDTLMG